MGLDSVELVMKVEEHFDIEIPDNVASTLETVGLLHDFVYQELQRRGRKKMGFTQVFDELREIICAQLGVHPRAVVSEAHFVRDLRVD
jgi:acyl carrier protein